MKCSNVVENVSKRLASPKKSNVKLNAPLDVSVQKVTFAYVKEPVACQKRNARKYWQMDLTVANRTAGPMLQRVYLSNEIS